MGNANSGRRPGFKTKDVVRYEGGHMKYKKIRHKGKIYYVRWSEDPAILAEAVAAKKAEIAAMEAGT
jgi:hypothetical protein